MGVRILVISGHDLRRHTGMSEQYVCQVDGLRKTPLNTVIPVEPQDDPWAEVTHEKVRLV